MGEHQILPKMWGRGQSAQVQGAEELWGVGQFFLPPLCPCFLPDFTHKAKMTINSPGALEPRSEPCQDINGCCLYSVQWCCTVCAAASSGLKELGFNSLWSDPSPTLGYLIVVMIICVLKTSMAPCFSLWQRSHSEVSWVTLLFGGEGWEKQINISNVLKSEKPL